MRRAKVYYSDELAGILEETPEGYRFSYDEAYLDKPGARAVSLSLPLAPEPYLSPTLFSFFEGLIPEGWYLEIVSRKLKIDPEDKFGILVATGSHTIGAVSAQPHEGV